MEQKVCASCRAGTSRRSCSASGSGTRQHLILDCPTRGVDVGVKQAMYQLMYRLRCRGSSIILISEELPELIGMSDRIIILKTALTAASLRALPSCPSRTSFTL